MTAVIVEAAVMAAQTKIGAVEVAEVAVEAAVAVAVKVTVNPKTSGETVRITKKITEIIRTKMVLKLHRVHPTHTKTKSAIPAVPSAT